MMTSGNMASRLTQCIRKHGKCLKQ
jgi:hypothetical protein